MQIVKDSKGTAWELVVNFDAVKRVKSDTKIDLGMAKYPGPSGAPLMVELYESPLQFLEVLWSICRIRAVNDVRINQSEFESRFEGPELDLARDVFLQEWEDFFQRLGRKPDAEALGNFRALMPRTISEALEVQRKELNQELKDSVTNTQS